MLSFIKKIVIGQKKMYIIMCFVLTILSAFELILLALYNGYPNVDSFSQIMIRLVPTVTIFVSFFLTLYINNFFIDNKTEEFSIILLSGRNLKQILKYIIVQFWTLFTITAVAGALLGMIVIQGLNMVLRNIGYTTTLIVNDKNSIAIFIALLIVKLVYVLVLDFGKFIRIKMNIADYMRYIGKESVKANFKSPFTVGEKKKKKYSIGGIISTLFAICILVISINSIMHTVDSTKLMFYFYFSLLAEVILINTTIPMLFDALHDTYLLKHPIVLHGMSQLMDVSKVLITTININAIVVPMMLALVFIPMLDANLEVVLICCYFIALMIILLTFIIRFALYLPTKRTDIATLKAIGYQRKQIARIQQIEILGFLVFIVGIPIIIYGFVLYQGYLLTTISINTTYFLIGTYVAVYVLLSSYMILTYKRLTKEVLSNVNYLNRGD